MTRPDSVISQCISGIALVVSDLDRAVAFYRDALDFKLDAREPHDEPPSTEALSLGGVVLRLTRFETPGAHYPAERAANDPWFQHFAIRVADMDEAYARISRWPISVISIGGPQQLPPSTGSVTAYKFRDPDGHPLELSFHPGEPATPSGSPFVTIEHSAIVVSDLDASIAFYVSQLGFVEVERLLNQGPAQWRLDGLDGALVDIVVLRPQGSGPHLELLHYRAPTSMRPPRTFSNSDLAATRLLIDLIPVSPNRSERSGRIVVDPDGHLVELIGMETQP